MPTKTFLKVLQVVGAIAGIAGTIAGIFVACILIFPSLGGLFQSPSQLRELKEHDVDKERRLIKQEQITSQLAEVLQELKANDKDKERRLSKAENSVEEHTRQIGAIESKIDRIENAITNSNQRTEASLKEMFIGFTKFTASSDIWEKMVTESLNNSNKAKLDAENATVFSEKAVRDIDALKKALSK